MVAQVSIAMRHFPHSWVNVCDRADQTLPPSYTRNLWLNTTTTSPFTLCLLSHSFCTPSLKIPDQLYSPMHKQLSTATPHEHSTSNMMLMTGSVPAALLKSWYSNIHKPHRVTGQAVRCGAQCIQATITITQPVK